MTVDDNFKTAKESVALVGELIKAAGDNPDVKAAGQELGKAALTVAKCINNALLPIAAINFGFEKARGYFANKFEAEMAEKAAQIPPEHVMEPKPSIAGPALQGLAFAHEEPNLKEMYLNLLASAMDDRRADAAHPAFVEIIRQLTSEEARLLRKVLQETEGLPTVEVRLQTMQSGYWVLLQRHLLNLRNTATNEPVENPRVPAMVDNWARLGLIEVTYDKFLTAEKIYDALNERPEIARFRTERETPEAKVITQRGIAVRTALGAQFARVVGLLDSAQLPATVKAPAE